MKKIAIQTVKLIQIQSIRIKSLHQTVKQTINHLKSLHQTIKQTITIQTRKLHRIQ